MQTKVLHYKLKADYHRYLADFASGTEDRNFPAAKAEIDCALSAYKIATSIAIEELEPSSSLRLLAHNFSRFYYDLRHSAAWLATLQRLHMRKVAKSSMTLVQNMKMVSESFSCSVITSRNGA